MFLVGRDRKSWNLSLMASPFQIHSCCLYLSLFCSTERDFYVLLGEVFIGILVRRGDKRYHITSKWEGGHQRGSSGSKREYPRGWSWETIFSGCELDRNAGCSWWILWCSWAIWFWSVGEWVVVWTESWASFSGTHSMTTVLIHPVQSSM